MCVQILEPKFTYPIFNKNYTYKLLDLQDFNMGNLHLIFNIALWAQFDLSWIQ